MGPISGKCKLIKFNSERLQAHIMKHTEIANGFSDGIQCMPSCNHYGKSFSYIERIDTIFASILDFLVLTTTCSLRVIQIQKIYALMPYLQIISRYLKIT